MNDENVHSLVDIDAELGERTKSSKNIEASKFKDTLNFQTWHGPWKSQIKEKISEQALNNNSATRRNVSPALKEADISHYTNYASEGKHKNYESSKKV